MTTAEKALRRGRHPTPKEPAPAEFPVGAVDDFPCPPDAVITPPASFGDAWGPGGVDGVTRCVRSR